MSKPKIVTREVLAWAFYDFANSAFTTLIVTFIFSAYFTRSVEPENGTFLWSVGVTSGALLVAMVTPFLGAVGDLTGRKKFFLVILTSISVTFTALLFFVRPGMALMGIAFFILAEFGCEAAVVLYNAFLPEISTKETIGRVSGFGWAFGYGGGLLCLLIALGMIKGWVSGDDFLAVRATCLLAAGWFLVFSIPMIVGVREKKPDHPLPLHGAARAGFRQLAATFRNVREYREVVKLLVARMIYNDALVTVFSFASIFSANALGMKTDEIIVLGLALNVVAGIGALALGHLADRIGGKKTIILTLVVSFIAIFIGSSSPTVKIFWFWSMVFGIMVGPNQAASRSLLGLLVPRHQHGEFFGFFAFSGKLASFMGPLIYSAVVARTGSHRHAMAAVSFSFLIGLVFLLFVKEKEGIALAQAHDDAQAEGAVML